MGAGGIRGGRADLDVVFRRRRGGWRHVLGDVQAVELVAPGRGAAGPLRAHAASVGIIVDEIEKGTHDRRHGRLDETLLAFLERASTARSIFDPALECEVDLSGVSYILTANDLAGLSRPLLDRAPPIAWPMPRREDLPLVAGRILAEIRRERGLAAAWLPDLDGQELDILSDRWRGGSLRPLRRLVEAVVSAREAFARSMPN